MFTVSLIYVAVVAAMYLLQEKLIFPGAIWQGTAAARLTPPPDAELTDATTSSGDRVAVLFGPALRSDGSPDEAASQRPTILFFYGNGMSLSAMGEEFAYLRRLGVNVCLPEYVGYGLSTGSPSEAACYATADAAYDWLIARGDVDASRIVVGGWSLGAAVAVDLAARRPTAGLILYSPFTSLTDAAKRQYPFLPVSALLRHRFASDEKIARVQCPILLGHGVHDQLVPAPMSASLASLAPRLFERFLTPAAGHNDFLDLARSQRSAAVARLLEAVQHPPAADSVADETGSDSNAVLETAE